VWNMYVPQEIILKLFSKEKKTNSVYFMKSRI
jgi:hypothetical protein